MLQKCFQNVLFGMNIGTISKNLCIAVNKQTLRLVANDRGIYEC